MRKILIANDDGITASGIIRLAEAAKRLGEVTVVAPDGQRSATSHAINLRDPIDVYPADDFPVEGVRAFKISGTPADCIRIGHNNIMKRETDIVLSGINKGYNCASDIQYSGTCGAAFEGAFQGVLSIAVSEGMTNEFPDIVEPLTEILEELMEKKLPDGQIWNVNFPECSKEECKGILRDRTVYKGEVYTDRYTEEVLPDGGIRYRVDGHYNGVADEGTDFEALLNNYISIGVVNNYH